jgi:hypothetical protein
MTERTDVPAHLQLRNQHTRELLDWLKHARACGGFYIPCDPASGGPEYTIEELKAELATREHIPSKQEGEAARRAHARLRHGKAKGKNR